ncbi:radical SAM protein [Methylomicrobium sp. Wu6]|uniref:radical SAM protein n=1 Tax=Methylomicrobium sp. Wu6 TaxID=3107928 RepID=UPI002DD65159|nr:radical SAM protein [Methylomicrobium sp. Wu6]MEC4749835.1 radical SAM protein [Methylomicrobium sp. Wu6]
MTSQLTAADHRRDSAGLTYIYPVLSRRAGGLSIGVNLNTNNACNWQCIYCQVPNLTIGAAPEPDFALLEAELRGFLEQVQSGDFYRRFQVPEAQRMIKDIAISGNGEPTSAPRFVEVVELIGNIATARGVFPGSRFVLITNGSLVHQPKVREGLKMLNQFGGEVWFKLDSATDTGRRLINNAGQSIEASLNNLILAANYCRTKVQICLVDIDRQGFIEQERRALLDALMTAKQKNRVSEILLYTIARPSLQPEAGRLGKMPETVMQSFADELRLSGFDVSISL